MNSHEESGPDDRDHIIGVLTEEWERIAALLSELDAAEWSTPTALPTWDVRDNVSHLIGIEATLAGDPQPPAPEDLAERAHVRNDLGAANEAWVEAFRGSDPAEVLRRFREVTARRTEQLRSMTDEDFAAPSWTPVGEDTYARFMKVRIFDSWYHEQDIREAVGRPGNEDGAAAAVALDEVVGALGYIVGKLGGAPDGSAVTFVLDGPLRREVHVEVRGRASVVPRLDRAPDAAIRMSSSTFLRLAGGRTDARSVLDVVHLDGDIDLASRIVGHLGYMI